MFRWLFWDGRHQLNGSCNQPDLVPDDSCAPLMGPAIYIPPGEPELSLVVPNAVDVALHLLVERNDGVALKIELHNPDHVRALMLRVYRGAREPLNLVYQEVLERVDLVALPEATAHGTTGIPALLHPPELTDDGQEISLATYTFEVWVANQATAFTPWTGYRAAGPIEPVAGALVHHRWRPAQPAGPNRAQLGMLAKPLPQDRTQSPHHLFIAAARDPASIRTALQRAAQCGSPFTEALVLFAKPLPHARPDCATLAPASSERETPR